MTSPPPGPSYILTFTAEDRVGIVAATTGFLADRDGFILDSQQYADVESGRFFMRVAFTPAGRRFPADLATLRSDFAAVAEQLGLEWTIADGSAPMKVMIAVSKGSHCLNDLLHRWSTGALPIDVTAVVSNHETCRALTEWHGLPFHHLPVAADSRAEQEARVAGLFHEAGSELLVLARYMQVLTPDLIARLAGRCINIHHSFLPSFKGANPYHRAHALGVKLIGATSHYVTPDLDEGPIIEQAVERIDHRASVDDMIRIGRDTEAQVLARAVAWAAERRILLNGRKTVVFR
ncbi:formyltetrahydrofolate deformylase [Allosphingosinicella deserti]|uniref:Formyltetrahydrofolate deformylase n=1 Tax=Allosphingosinicella deserti TaxID=2116704 RepID=A0A2P7QIX8_9SPHN|nr:formyltetrahydrofolate deformylase [Sphingomonas deserti]PSJ37928.1 formyltetrahydrofolate deformylase [Sphingomonas deserti]